MTTRITFSIDDLEGLWNMRNTLLSSHGKRIEVLVEG